MFPQYSLEKCTTSPSPSCQTAWRFSGTGSSSTVNLKRSRERSRESIFCSFGKKRSPWNCYILSKCRKYLIFHISHINIYTHYILTSYTCPYFFKENPRNSQKIIHLIPRNYSGSMQTKRIRCETCHFHGNLFRWSITHIGTCSRSPSHFRSRVFKVHSKFPGFPGFFFFPRWTPKTIKKPPLHRCYVSLVANRAALVWVSETALSRQGASNLFLENFFATKSLWEIKKKQQLFPIHNLHPSGESKSDWGSIVYVN